jgi:hypothetical protein
MFESLHSQKILRMCAKSRFNDWLLVAKSVLCGMPYIRTLIIGNQSFSAHI